MIEQIIIHAAGGFIAGVGLIGVIMLILYLTDF